MATKGTRNLTVPGRVFIILSFALLGFTGTFFAGGTGSLWLTEAFTFSALFTLMTWAFFGNRRSMSYETIPPAIILFVLTGIRRAPDLSFCNNKLQTIAVLALFGFGLIPFFAFFIASRFSEKKYGAYHFIILITVFLVGFIAMAFGPAEMITARLLPELSSAFKSSISLPEETSVPVTVAKMIVSPGALYADSYSDQYIGFVHSVCASAGTLLSAAVSIAFFRDEFSSLLSLVFSLVSALSFVLAYPVCAKIPAVVSAEIGSPVRLAAGIIFGFFFALVLCLIPGKKLNGEGKYKERSHIKGQNGRYFYGSAAVVFFSLFLSVSATAFGGVYSAFSKAAALRVIIAAAVVMLVASFALTRKNYLTRALDTPFTQRVENFSLIYLPCAAGVVTLAGFICKNRLLLNASAVKAEDRMTIISALLPIAAFILFAVFHACAGKITRIKKPLKKQKRK